MVLSANIGSSDSPWVLLVVAVSAGGTAAGGPCAFDPGASLLLGLDGVTPATGSLNARGVEHRRAWDALCRKADDVIHLVDALGASVVLQLAYAVAPGVAVPQAI